ncbi:hypothetical protein L6R52_10300 [Myxococcota bacterium]|nr:hypothetical protein [Myxococcota bacterium]
MTRSSKLLSLSSLAVSAALAACGTETGNGLGTVSVKAGLTSSSVAAQSDAAPVEPPVLVGTDAQGTPLRIVTASTYVRRIDFDRPGGKTDCGEYKPSNTERVKCDGGKLRLNGPFVIDLVTRTATPSLDGLELLPDVYKRVEVFMEAGRAGDGPVAAGDALDGATLVASGSIAYPAGSATDFDLSLRFTDMAAFTSAEGITVEAGTTPQDVLLDLDVASWFAALPITQCLDDGDLTIENGRIAIADKGNGSCKMIEAELKDAIKASGRLAKRK